MIGMIKMYSNNLNECRKSPFFRFFVLSVLKIGFIYCREIFPLLTLILLKLLKFFESVYLNSFFLRFRILDPLL